MSTPKESVHVRKEWSPDHREPLRQGWPTQEPRENLPSPPPGVREGQELRKGSADRERSFPPGQVPPEVGQAPRDRHVLQGIRRRHPRRHGPVAWYHPRTLGGRPHLDS